MHFECPGLSVAYVQRIVLLITVFCSMAGRASVYEIDLSKNTVFGEVAVTTAVYEQTLPDIARVHNLGFDEIKLANPDVDTWIPGESREIVLPRKFILPMAEYEGIVLNIPEMRLYYFPRSGEGEAQKVITHPVGIGREGWSTPYVNTKIIQKREQPVWYPPESIREEHAAEGRPLPKRVGPGPENPLGDFAMRLGLPDYLLHGTNRPYGVGMRVSHGCIRLYPEDIESLYRQVDLGTRVHIINQPYKAGILDGRIFLEAHPYLLEDREMFEGNLTSVVKMIVKLSGEQRYEVDWALAKQVISDQDGMPVAIGRIITALEKMDPANTDAAGGKILPVAHHGLDLILETSLGGEID